MPSPRRLAASLLLVAALPCLADESAPRAVARLGLERRFGVQGTARPVVVGGRRVHEWTQVEIDGRGRVVVAGHVAVRRRGQGVDDAPVIARFLPDGRLDRTFGRGGAVAAPFLGRATGLAVDGDDRVVICGPFHDASSDKIAPPRHEMSRFLEDGALDESFGTFGFASPELPGLERVRTGPDGALFALSWRRYGVVARYTENGALDRKYGVDGAAESPVGAALSFTALAVDGRGRAVASGEYGVVRYAADGRPDESAGVGGQVAGAVGRVFGEATFDGADRLLVVGADAHGPAVFRFGADGRPDPTFGVDGRAGVPRAVPADAWTPRETPVVACSESGLCAAVGDYRVVRPGLGTRDGSARFVQLFDPVRPHWLPVYVRAEPAGVQTTFTDVAVSRDGAGVYAVGSRTLGDGTRSTPLLVRVDPVRVTGSQSISDVLADWAGTPDVTLADAHPVFDGVLRVHNVGDATAKFLAADFRLSDDDRLDPDDIYLGRTYGAALEAGGQGYLSLEGLTALTPGGVAGKRIIAVMDRFEGLGTARLRSYAVVVSAPLR
jgi:uncharacterized delta-60 repeat protein